MVLDLSIGIKLQLAGKFLEKSTLCAIAGNKVGILTTTYNLLTFFHNVTQLTLTLVILSTHSQPLSLLGQWTVKSWISFLTHPSGKTCKRQTKNRVDSCLHVKRLGTRFSNVSKLQAGGINPFVTLIRTRFKLWNLAVILLFLTSEKYQSRNFSRQADHSFRNCFSGPISYRVFRETAPRMASSRLARYGCPLLGSEKICLKLKQAT